MEGKLCLSDQKQVIASALFRIHTQSYASVALEGVFVAQVEKSMRC